MTTSDLAPKDAELIAAFIDRRLPKEERQAFLERLDREEALYEVFVETVRYRDETSGNPSVLEHPTWRKKWTLPAAIAALLALAVATPYLILSLSDKSYAEALVADGRLDPYLGEGWYNQPWSEMRGVQLGKSQADTAFRIGVQVVDLEVALRTQRIEHAESLAARIEAHLVGVESSAPFRYAYARLQENIDRGVDSEQLIRLAASNKELLADYLPHAAAYRLGRFAEAGKLAARSGNANLLRSSSFMSALRDLRRRQTWDEGVREGLTRISALLASPIRDLDFEQLEQEFSAVIRES